MKTRFEVPKIDREDLIALFGSGRLVRVSRLLLELRGGSREDEIEAVGWISMFMPDSVLKGREMLAVATVLSSPRKAEV